MKYEINKVASSYTVDRVTKTNGLEFVARFAEKADAEKFVHAMDAAAALEKLTSHLEEYLDDCDHSVGICFCDIQRDLEDAKNIVAGINA